MSAKGLYFEDYEVGQEIVTPARTVTEADITLFAALTGDWNPLHTDAEFAKKTIFKQRIAHGLLTLSIASGLVARTGILYGTVVAFYGIDKLRFTAPVYIGDTIKAIIKVLDKQEKELGGLITAEMRVVNQRDETVLYCTMKMLVKRRGG